MLAHNASARRGFSTQPAKLVTAEVTMDFWDIEKQVTRNHAYFAERTIRTIKEAMLRRVAAGAGRRGQWHLMLADILS